MISKSEKERRRAQRLKDTQGAGPGGNVPSGNTASGQAGLPKNWKGVPGFQVSRPRKASKGR